MEDKEVFDGNWLKDLPEDPKKMTFPGRYSHADRVISEMVGTTGNKVRVLDYGSGLLNHGSPTAVDLAKSLKAHGNQVEMVAYDIHQPENFSPADQDIEYKTRLERSDTQFDIVRMFHVAEHVRDEMKLREIREDITKRLREGGFFLTTQYFYEEVGRDAHGSRVKPAGQAIKIMQKVNGELKAIALLPDANLGWNPGQQDMWGGKSLDDYHQFRQQVLAGQASLDTVPRYPEFNLVINNLTDSGWDEQHHAGFMQSLSAYDVFTTDVLNKDESLTQLSEEGQHMLDIMSKDKQQAAHYFANPKKSFVDRLLRR